MNTPFTSDEIFFAFAIFSLAAAITALLIRSLIFEKSLPKSHIIAVIGQETSGKTTLITSLFGELFARKVFGARATPLGRSSVQRVNQDLEKLERGFAVGPTRDQETFAYRANITIGSGFVGRTFKVEIGDYAGKKSVSYAKRRTKRAVKDWTEVPGFISWVNQADAFLFTIDLARYLANARKSKIYVAQVSGFIRKAWQNIQNEHQDVGKLDRKPVVIAFTKTDLFELSDAPATLERVENQIIRLGFGKKVPLVRDINPKTLAKGELRVRKDFAELLRYFEGSSRNFDAIFVSSFGTVLGRRLNFSKLLKSLLPQSGSFLMLNQR